MRPENDRWTMRQFLLALMVALLAVPAAFAQTGTYRIQPGDTVDVTVLEDPDLNRRLLVLPDGRISVPFAGNVAVAGRTIEEVERVIADRLAPQFAVRPNVFVAMASVAETAQLQRVYVLGQVGTPGLRELEPGTTLLQAISLAGGFGRFAATRRIQLRRTDLQTGQERLFLFNYNAIERGGAITSMITLRDGDVIIVPERRLFE
jgi:polysaccharide biosynthesis/export protein